MYQFKVQKKVNGTTILKSGAILKKACFDISFISLTFLIKSKL